MLESHHGHACSIPAIHSLHSVPKIHMLIAMLFRHPTMLASLTVCRGHIPCLPPGLFHFMSQPRAFTGRAACSLWCGYRIVYRAIPDTELHPLPRPESYAMQHCLTSSGAGYVTYTITAHHDAALSLLPVSVYPAQAMHPVMPHRFLIARTTSFA